MHLCYLKALILNEDRSHDQRTDEESRDLVMIRMSGLRNVIIIVKSCPGGALLPERNTSPSSAERCRFRKSLKGEEKRKTTKKRLLFEARKHKTPSSETQEPTSQRRSSFFFVNHV